MSLTTQQTQALYKLYPNAVHIVGSVAYHANGNEVEYDLEAVNAQAKADEQAVIDAKETSLAKLAKLGLTPEDLKALLG